MVDVAIVRTVEGGRRIITIRDMLVLLVVASS